MRNLPSAMSARRQFRDELHERRVVQVVTDTVRLDDKGIPSIRGKTERGHIWLIGEEVSPSGRVRGDR